MSGCNGILRDSSLAMAQCYTCRTLVQIRERESVSEVDCNAYSRIGQFPVRRMVAYDDIQDEKYLDCPMTMLGTVLNEKSVSGVK